MQYYKNIDRSQALRPPLLHEYLLELFKLPSAAEYNVGLGRSKLESALQLNRFTSSVQDRIGSVVSIKGELAFEDLETCITEAANSEGLDRSVLSESTSPPPIKQSLSSKHWLFVLRRIDFCKTFEELLAVQNRQSFVVAEQIIGDHSEESTLFRSWLARQDEDRHLDEPHGGGDDMSGQQFVTDAGEAYLRRLDDFERRTQRTSRDYVRKAGVESARITFENAVRATCEDSNGDRVVQAMCDLYLTEICAMTGLRPPLVYGPML